MIRAIRTLAPALAPSAPGEGGHDHTEAMLLFAVVVTLCLLIAPARAATADPYNSAYAKASISSLNEREYYNVFASESVLK